MLCGQYWGHNNCLLALVLSLSLAGIVGSNTAGALSPVNVVYCQVEVSATGCSPVQRIHTECGVSQCDRESLIMRRPWPTRGCCAMVYRVSQEECARLREGVPYVKVYRYNPKHLCPKLNGYRDNGQRKLWSSGGSTHCTCQLTSLIDVCP